MVLQVFKVKQFAAAAPACCYKVSTFTDCNVVLIKSEIENLSGFTQNKFKMLKNIYSEEKLKARERKMFNGAKRLSTVRRCV